MDNPGFVMTRTTWPARRSASQTKPSRSTSAVSTATAKPSAGVPGQHVLPAAPPEHSKLSAAPPEQPDAGPPEPESPPTPAWCSIPGRQAARVAGEPPSAPLPYSPGHLDDLPQYHRHDQIHDQLSRGVAGSTVAPKANLWTTSAICLVSAHAAVARFAHRSRRKPPAPRRSCASVGSSTRHPAATRRKGAISRNVRKTLIALRLAELEGLGLDDRAA